MTINKIKTVGLAQSRQTRVQEARIRNVLAILDNTWKPKDNKITVMYKNKI
jgi:hypothetical protein